MSAARDNRIAPGSRIAVIGGGVAGIVAAYLLQRRYRVTLYEKNDYVGGHTNTIELREGPDAGLKIDTGFIVCNRVNYPLFQKFLAELGVGLRDAEMSFSYYCERSGFQYGSSGWNGLFRAANLCRPRFWSMVRDILRFNREAARDVSNGISSTETLGEYLKRRRFGRAFTEQYLVPMGAAIWSCPMAGLSDFPVAAFLRFFDNHRLLQIDGHTVWQTVVGGSATYVKAFRDRFPGQVETCAGIDSIDRQDGAGVAIRRRDGQTDRYDAAVLATHADQALRLLRDPTPNESKLLGAWRYQPNRTLLHHDTTFLPPSPSARASWNYVRFAEADASAPVSVTYDMNRLQGLSATRHYLVTLNPSRPPAADRVIYQTVYEHPIYTSESIASQAALPSLQGVGGVFFCGSYFGNGFHEDAVRSAVEMSKGLGIDF